MDPFERLRNTVYYAKLNSPHYKQLPLPSEDEFSIDSYKQLPFTSKDDLANDNESFRAVELKEIADYVTTSGTTGDPITIYLTKNDLKRLAKNERDSMVLMGNTTDDIFQLLTTIDKQFMAGIAYFLGVQELGAGMIRIGPGVPSLQWNSILKNKPTKLIAVPSFIVALIEYAKDNNIDFKNSSVRSIICIGEPIRNDNLEFNTLGKRIKDNWNVDLYSTYASTEMGAAFSECVEQKGCHLNDELLYLEVLDENGQEVQDGELGEIVVTTLGVEGTPLIRYKTGDIARVFHSSCNCGSSTPRLGPIVGRKQQMIKYKGTTLFPKAIFEVADNFPDISCYKVLVSKDELNNDLITLVLDNKLQNTNTLSSLKEMCKSKLRVVPNFEFKESDELRGMVYKKNLRKPEKILFTN